MHIWTEVATFTITVAGSNVRGSNAGSNHDLLGATLSLLPPTSCQNDCLPLQNDKSPLKSSQVFPALAEAGHTPRSMEDGVLMRSEWSQSSKVQPYAASTKLLGSLTGNSCPSPRDFLVQRWDPGPTSFSQLASHLISRTRPPEERSLPCLQGCNTFGLQNVRQIFKKRKTKNKRMNL